MLNTVPFVSVIIVNYNGAHYLKACLEALKIQSYPSDRFEVIVSDNGSSDGSLELITQHYRNIRVLENKKNLGFASGNNVAIQVARGNFMVLLNNDTAPTPAWLENFVETAVRHPDAGLVTGRIQLYYDQLTLTLSLQTETATVLSDIRGSGVKVFGVETGLPGGVVQYLEGFSGRQHQSGQPSFRWFSGSAKIGVSVPPGSDDWFIDFLLAADWIGPLPIQVEIGVGEEILDTWEVTDPIPKRYTLSIPRGARSKARPIIQNAGSIVFQNGAGRDRGTVVRNFESFYEEDYEQFDKEEEVFAGCGANLLLRREMLKEVGFFDHSFFMYYEDTDLSWRARLKGWKVFYAPQAIIRHIHCGTSQEWSPSFIFYTDRNRLALLFKNGTFSSIAREWGGYFLKPFGSILQITRDLLRQRKIPRVHWATLKIRSKVLFSLFCWLPRLVKERRVIQKSRSVPESDITRWLMPLS